MFRLIGWILKATLFAVVVLVGSHFIHWEGRTINDQVSSSLSSAERSPAVRSVKKKSSGFFESAREAAERALQSDSFKQSGNPEKTKKDEIPLRDKRQLQSLIESEKNQS